jgi:hypothetical protein
MGTNHPVDPRRNDMRQILKLHTNRAGQAGAVLGVALAVWLAVGAPSNWY